MHAGFSGLRAFGTRKIVRCNLTGNRRQSATLHIRARYDQYCQTTDIGLSHIDNRFGF